MGKTYHFGPAEVVDQITLEWQTISLKVGRGPISFWCRLPPQLFSEFYLFYFPRYKQWAGASNNSQLRKKCWLMLPSFSGFIQPLSVAVLGCQPPFPFSSFSHRFLFRPSATLKHNDSKRTLTNADINYFVSPPSSSGPSHINSGQAFGHAYGMGRSHARSPLPPA